MPTRLIPIEEAKARGWANFFQGAPCRYGHIAPRYTSNHRKCVDCTRLKLGKGTIGELSGVDGVKANKGNQVGRASGIVVRVEKPEKIDGWERRFLEAYAFQKDFKKACDIMSLNESQVLARLSYSPSFKIAYDALEERVGIKRVNTSEGFVWTDEKYDKLIEVYINTGDLASARDSIGVTPFAYFKELERNSIFAARITEANPLAHLALEERAIQLALAGNDKLLTKVLSVKKPEYKDNIKVDMNVTEKLNDRQLEARLFRLIDKLQPVSVIEGQYQEAPEARTSGAIEDSRGNGPSEVSTEDRHILPHAGSS